MTVQTVTIPLGGTPTTVTAPAGETIITVHYEVNGSEMRPASDGLVTAVATRNGADEITAVDLATSFTFGSFVGYVTSL